MKPMPLLILGKRQSGKSTALVRFAKTINNVMGYAPYLEQGRYVFKKEIEFVSSSCKLKGKKGKEINWVIDEFSMCHTIPKTGRIVALTDDIDNLQTILRKLKELGYPVR